MLTVFLLSGIILLLNIDLTNDGRMIEVLINLLTKFFN